MSHDSFIEENALHCIDELRSIPEIVACALVSCEGTVLGKYSREGSLPSLFAAMCATVLASAEAACGSVHVRRPSLVAIVSADATVLIAAVGEAALIAAVIDKSADLPTIQGRLSSIAVRIGGEV